MMIAEINSEEDKRPVLRDLLCNDMYDICMQCFQGSRGVNKKLLESESGSLKELHVAESPSSRVELTISSGS